MGGREKEPLVRQRRAEKVSIHMQIQIKDLYSHWPTRGRRWHTRTNDSKEMNEMLKEKYEPVFSVPEVTFKY